MFHGVYIKSRPQNKSWYLFSIAVSAEAATYDLTEAIKHAHAEGNDQAEAAVEVFETGFHIPETLSTIKSKKPCYN